MIQIDQILNHRLSSIFNCAVLDDLWCPRCSVGLLSRHDVVLPRPTIHAVRPRNPRTGPVCWFAVPLSFTSHFTFFVYESIRARRHYGICKFCMQVSRLWIYIICKQCRCWRRLRIECHSLEGKPELEPFAIYWNTANDKNHILLLITLVIVHLYIVI